MKLIIDGLTLPLAHFDLEVTAELSSGVTGIGRGGSTNTLMASGRTARTSTP